MDTTHTFNVSAPGTYPVKCFLFHDGEEDRYYALSSGATICATYSADQVAERARLNGEPSVADDEQVIIAGRMYRTKVNGAYADAAYFIPV